MLASYENCFGVCFLFFKKREGDITENCFFSKKFLFNIIKIKFANELELELDTFLYFHFHRTPANNKQ